MEPPEERKGPDLDRIGLFKEMSYHNEYVPHRIVFNEESKKGKQMLTNMSRTRCGTQDGYFDTEFTRVFEGESLADPIRLRRRDRLATAEKNRPPGYFNRSSPPKKSSGKGSAYGTIGEAVPHFSTGLREREKTAPPLKNFYVNPPKKGTGYGYPNITIGKPPPYFLDEEYEELKDATVSPKKPEPRPFLPYKAGLYQQGYFDPNPWREVEQKERKHRDAAEVERKIAPYFPPSPAKKDGGMKAGCLNKFPEWMTDPLLKLDGVPRGVRHFLNDKNQMFRPVPGIKPYPVKSIIQKNIQKSMNPQNFAVTKGVVYCKGSQQK